jgi:FAD/FMN-containing dehydrogenase
MTTDLASYGLGFGPDSSTRARCTLGGMIGNNACGSRVDDHRLGRKKKK